MYLAEYVLISWYVSCTVEILEEKGGRLVYFFQKQKKKKKKKNHHGFDIPNVALHYPP